MNAISYERIGAGSNRLAEVIRLGKSFASTLGLFPEGAFVEYAQKEGIIIASEGNAVAGYILFRESRNVAVVVHLCINDAFRRRGIALELVSRLKSCTSHLDGIKLKCRRDYEATKFWPKAGFVAGKSVPGRGKIPAELTIWWLDYHNAPLLKAGQSAVVDRKLQAVIDTDVFLDLHSQEETESRCLTQDWIADELHLCITGELLNEINKRDDPAERKSRYEAALKYPQLECPPEDFEASVKLIAEKFKKNILKEADLRHLARAHACGSKVFVTRDQGILKHEEEIYNALGISVVDPVRLTIHIDELNRENDYQPARLAGGAVTAKKMTSRDLERICSIFHKDSGETKRFLRGKLSELLQDSSRTVAQIISGPEGEYGFVVAVRSRDVVELPIFRVLKSSTRDTLARHLVLQEIRKAVDHGYGAIQVTDSTIDADMKVALAESGFVPHARGPIKVALRGIETMSDARRHLERVFADAGVDGADLLPSTIHPLAVERMAWPLKISDAAVESFIVPIQPKWAQHLFDEKLVENDMFGLTTTLGLNREGVYYRSILNSRGLKSPARILWYVSQDASFSQTGAIRACSFLDEVLVDKPKEIFRRFRRLGIYSYRNIVQIVGHDPEKNVMALRFSDTVLMNPVDRRIMQAALSGQNKKLMLQSPIRISPDEFETLYRSGLK